nr:MAG TPA: NTP-PPase-like protein [Bacteriophage sp.]
MIETDAMVEQYLSVCKLNPLWKKPGGDLQQDINYLYLGMLAEIGEVAEIFQKHVRDGVPIDPKDVLDELGDVAFYVHMLAAKGYGDVITCKMILGARIGVLPFDNNPISALRTLRDMNLKDIYSVMVSIGQYYGFGLHEILAANVTKLKRRIKNGSIRGSGSHR